MIVWFLLFLLMCLVYTVEYFGNRKPTLVNEMTICLVVLLSVLSGLRGEVGVDLEVYKTVFENIPPLHHIIFEGARINPSLAFEPLYNYIISAFKIFTGNYNLFLFFQSLFLFIIVVKSFRRLKVPVNIGLILYFFLSYLDHYGQQRMAIIYVLCLFATTFIVKKELKKFLLTIVLASLIHYTAIFFLPAYWIRYLFLSKSIDWSKKFDSLRDFRALSDVRAIFNEKIQLFRTEVRLISIILLFTIALFVAWRFNIAQLLYQNIALFTFGDPQSNVLASKFITYFEKQTEALNIANAWVGLLSYVAVLVFLYIYRKRWLDVITAPVFINFCAGLIFYVIAYNIPKLGVRLFQMYWLPTYLVLFGIILSQKERPWNVIPFIIFICMYKFFGQIFSETGSYTIFFH